MEMEREYYRSLEASREETARFRHDFNNQLAVVKRMLRAGDIENSKELVGQLKGKVVFSCFSPSFLLSCNDGRKGIFFQANKEIEHAED